MRQLEKYKRYKIIIAKRMMNEGIFTQDEVAYLSKHYLESDITIMGTPSKLSEENLEKWSIIGPLVHLINLYENLDELRKAGAIEEQNWQEMLEKLKNGQSLGSEVDQMLNVLIRLKYGLYRGQISQEGYKNTVKLIKYAMENNAELNINVEPGSIAEEIGLEENISPLDMENGDTALRDARRLLKLTIEAWETNLGWKLKDDFANLLINGSTQQLEDMRYKLVSINKAYYADTRPVEEKNKEYFNQLRSISPNYNQVGA
jgi:hypothetical protein